MKYRRHYSLKWFFRDMNTTDNKETPLIYMCHSNICAERLASVLSAVIGSEVIGRKVTLLRLTEPFQCQISLLCPPRHVWREENTARLSLLTSLACSTLFSVHSISAYTCSYTEPVCVCVEWDAFVFVLSLNNSFPQRVWLAVRVVGRRRRRRGLQDVVLAPGPEAKWGQTLTDVHKSTDTQSCYRPWSVCVSVSVSVFV